MSGLLRPPVNRAMRVLDPSLFQKDISIAAARVFEARNISRVRRAFEKSKDLFIFRLVSPVISDPTPDVTTARKCVLLRPEIRHDDSNTWSETVKDLVGAGDIGLIPCTVRLGYENWTTYDILSSVLPEDLLDDIPTSFSTIGHIAHMNLRTPYLPHKTLIANIVLSKNPNLQTVINKTHTLDSHNTYRTLDFEHLAGTPNYLVTTRENALTYRFDMSKVFWNPRLNTEHQRLAQLFKPGEAVCDVMAGVGPFAIPAGKRETFVWANDLNPDCFEALQDAIEINKVGAFVRAFKMDGHEFIRCAAKQLLDTEYIARLPVKVSRSSAAPGEQATFRSVPQPRTFAHFVMNLPSTAPDFLRDFWGIYQGHEDLFEPYTATKLPMVHCYCFGPKEVTEDGEHDAHEAGSEDHKSDLDDAQPTIAADDDDIDAKRRTCELISHKLGAEITLDMTDVDIFDVRDVAPNKRQFCASFRLPAEVAFAKSGA